MSPPRTSRGRSSRHPYPEQSVSAVSFDVPTADGREIISMDWHGKFTRSGDPLPSGSIPAAAAAHSDLCNGLPIFVQGRDGEYFTNDGIIPGEPFQSVDQLLHAAADYWLSPCDEEEEHAGGATQSTLQQPDDVSTLKNLLDSTKLEEESPITGTSSSSPRDTIWARIEWEWSITFYTRVDLGGSFHTRPDVGGPFQSLHEADKAINLYLLERQDPTIWGVEPKWSGVELAIRKALYYPDGTRKKGPVDERRRWMRQMVHVLLDKYNEDQNSLGEFAAYELKDIVCFETLCEANSNNTYFHVNFTAKTKSVGIENLFFAEVKSNSAVREGDYIKEVVSCIRRVYPNDKGNCYACARRRRGMKHPNNATSYTAGHVEDAYYPFLEGASPWEGSGKEEWGGSDEAEEARLRHLFKGVDDVSFMEKPPQLLYGEGVIGISLTAEEWLKELFGEATGATTQA